MIPTGKIDPDRRSEVRELILQLSEAVGSIQLTNAVQSPEAADSVMSAGMFEIAGACVSVTTISTAAVD